MYEFISKDSLSCSCYCFCILIFHEWCPPMVPYLSSWSSGIIIGFVGDKATYRSFTCQPFSSWMVTLTPVLGGNLVILKHVPCRPDTASLLNCELDNVNCICGAPAAWIAFSRLHNVKMVTHVRTEWLKRYFACLLKLWEFGCLRTHFHPWFLNLFFFGDWSSSMMFLVLLNDTEET